MATKITLKVERDGETYEHSMDLEDHVEEDINYFIRFYAKQCAIEVIDQIREKQ